MKQNRLIFAILALALIAFISGCYPEKIDYIDEFDLAATYVNDSADFSAYLTFHVVDTVMHITDEGEDDPNLSREHDEFILETVRLNMLDLGYTELVSPDSLNMPDLALLVEVSSTDFYTYFSYWYDYWYWYPGWNWWYPGWGGWYPGYPWYPGGGYYNTFSTGTVMVHMLDTEAEATLTERPGMVWLGVVDGILTNSGSTTQARLDKQLNQLFEQSPYLQK